MLHRLAAGAGTLDDDGARLTDIQDVMMARARRRVAAK